MVKIIRSQESMSLFKSDGKQTIDDLRRTALCDGLDDKDIEYILNIGTISTYAKGNIIYHQQSAAEFLYIVLEGMAKIYCNSAEGREAILQLVKPPEIILEPGALLDSQSQTMAEALTRVVIFIVPIRYIKGLCIENARLAQNLLAIVAKRYQEMIWTYDSAVLKSPYERIGNYLLHAFLQGGAFQMTFKLNAPKSIIASILNMKPETFSRSLAMLKSDGIRVAGQEIILANEFSLCGFCDMNTAHRCQRIGKAGCTAPNFNM